MDWEAQRQRIKRNEILNSTAFMIKVVAKDGKNRDVLCLPLGYLNGWLAGIEACVVFFTLTVSAALFFLFKKDGLDINIGNNIIWNIASILGFIPAVILLFKLISNGIKIRGWRIVGFSIIVFLVTLLVFFLSIFSLHKVVPEVIRLFNT